jgi:hypothetical protein
MLDEMAEDGERLRREVEPLVAAPRPPGVRLDPNRGNVAGLRAVHQKISCGLAEVFFARFHGRLSIGPVSRPAPETVVRWDRYS